MSEQQRQIGEVAEILGLSLRTIRHYDEVGIVPPSARSKGGFRLYTEDDIARLRLIKRMKPLGFTLEEMRDLLEVVDELDRPGTAPDRRDALIGRLSTYRDATRRRAQVLREQVDMAIEFEGQLTEQIVRRVPSEPRPQPIG